MLRQAPVRAKRALRPNDPSWLSAFACCHKSPYLTLPDAPSQQTSRRRPAPAGLFLWGIGTRVTHPLPIVMCVSHGNTDMRPVYPGLAGHPWNNPSRRMLSFRHPQVTPTTAVPEPGALQDLAPSLGRRGNDVKPPDAGRLDWCTLPALPWHPRLRSEHIVTVNSSRSTLTTGAGWLLELCH